MIKIKTLLIPFMLFSLVFAILTYNLYEERRREIKDSLTTNLNFISTKIEFRIQANFLILYNVAANVAYKPEITFDEFNKVVNHILKHPNSLKNVALAPDFTFKYVYPLEGNESIIGVSLLDLQEQREEALKAKRENRMILAGPLDLIQGGRGLIARIPIFIENNPDKFWGLLSSVLDFEELMTPVKDIGENEGINIFLIDPYRSSSIIWGATVMAEDSLFVEREINLPDRVWNIRVSPVDSSIFSFKEKVLTLILYISLLILIESIFVFYLKRNQRIKHGEERLRDFLISSTDWAWEIDSDYKFNYTSDNVYDFLKYTKWELFQRTLPEIVSIDGGYNVRKKLLGLLESNTGIRDFQVWVTNKMGEKECLSINCIPTIDNEVFTGYRGVGKNITEIKETELRYKEYLNIVNDNVPISQTDLNGNITMINRAFSKQSGYKESDLIGESHRIMNHPETPKHLFKDMWNTITQKKIWEGEFKNFTKNRNVYWFKVKIIPLIDIFENHYGYMAVRQDISAEKRLEEISVTDPLTGVFNRRKIDEVLNSEYIRFKRSQSCFSLILLDIDHFKRCNDTYGHQIGDTVLVEVTKILKDNIREVDVLGRWGGEEFLIICLDTDIDGVTKLAEILKDKIEHHTFPHVQTITCSFGVSTIKSDLDTSSLIRITDDALYVAKSEGRNCVRVAKEDISL